MSITSRARGVLYAAAALASLGAAQAQTPEFQRVAIPVLPQDAVCAEEKTAIVDRAAVANAGAAQNAQIATRLLAERQAQLRADGATDSGEIERLRAERDRRLDEWRRAEAAYDASGRLATRDCSAPRAAEIAPPAPAGRVEAPSPPVAQPAPAGAAPAGSSLALTLSAPETCRANAVCTLVVEIENRGAEPYPSPLLASVALGFDGGAIASVAPDSWTCGRGGDALTCTSGGGLVVAPGARTRFTVDWRLPERLRRPSASVCAAVVWPGRAPGGVYRAEQVAAVQYALTRGGFDTNGVTGRIGPRTLEAIRQFRQRANIQGTAEITPDLTSALFGDNGARTGDANAADDRACATVRFIDDRGAPVASVAPTRTPADADAEAAAPAPRAAPREAARPTVRAERPDAAEVRPQREARRPVRRPPPRVVEEDDDETVTVYTTRVRPPVYYYGEPRWRGGGPYYYRPAPLFPPFIRVW